MDVYESNERGQPVNEDHQDASMEPERVDDAGDHEEPERDSTPASTPSISDIKPPRTWEMPPPSEAKLERGEDGTLGQDVSSAATGEWTEPAALLESERAPIGASLRGRRPSRSLSAVIPAIRPKTSQEDENQPSLSDPDYYINRELSWLEFNQRVLELAMNEETPLLERLKFLCISSTNLDEFFEVRVARLMQQVHLQSSSAGPDGMQASTQLDRIRAFTHEFVETQYRVLNDEILPSLDDEGIRFLRRNEWNEVQADWIAHYFRHEVLPVLSPLALDPAHPFPRVLNKSLNFIISLAGEDAFGRTSGVAVVQAPRSLPRLTQLPPEVAGGQHDFVFLTSIIHQHVNELFAGMQVRGCYQFRVTRNAELFVDEEEVEDLMIALEDELYGRHFGDAVRLEVADNCPMEGARFLLDQFELGEESLYQVNGPVNLNRLMMIPGAVDRPDLKYPNFVPSTSGKNQFTDIFQRLRGEDVLLHHPFESFSTVIDFVRQAANDPNVLAIKQTLYRTEGDSVLVDALVDAARVGKEVTAVIELRARFDEERNIQIAGRLQEAGAHVVYGVVGYKTHAKLLLVVRREEGGLRRYVHLGTGNYHPRTARLYTDFGLLSSDAELGEDVHKMFQQLTGLSKVLELNKALQAPFSLHPAIIDKIEGERARALHGERAHIMAKMNSLTEVDVIRALYRASQAGVRVDLIVRGICRLKPGIPGVSENIHVRSIVGRFLEHTRTYYFYASGREEVFCASADWMTRNLLRRVEAAFPIEDPALKQRVIHESFEVYLKDNCRAWVLQPNARYVKLSPEPGVEPFVAQRVLINELAEQNTEIL